ncbi:MAG TPA: J domain-containing protein [Thermodesulfobacteriota bacterium]|nr:J domain-containing protein [Thermodesulfobacteriota bacterium]
MGKETPATDYYEVLQVNPRADREIIERAYRLLAKRYHPDNEQTGDASKFEILVEAYRVLSDPEKRAAYDDNHKAATAYQSDIFSSAPESGSAEWERKIYQAILLILYFVRRRDSIKPGVGIVELEGVVGLPEKEMEFHIWYLKEKGWIQRLDTGEFAITASGVDEVIENNLLLRKDRLLPYFDESSPKKSKSGETPKR